MDFVSNVGTHHLISLTFSSSLSCRIWIRSLFAEVTFVTTSCPTLSLSILFSSMMDPRLNGVVGAGEAGSEVALRDAAEGVEVVEDPEDAAVEVDADAVVLVVVEAVEDDSKDVFLCSLINILTNFELNS